MTQTTREYALAVPPDFVISDTHFSHKRIMEICPWRTRFAETLEEHDRVLIAAWNAAVQPGQTVLHCGDFAFGPRDALAPLRALLNGRIILVMGNHDRSATQCLAAGFDVATKLAVCSEGGTVYRFRHRPEDFTDSEIANSEYLMHGHVHDRVVSQELADKCRGKLVNLCMDYSLTTAPTPWATVSHGLKPLP